MPVDVDAIQKFAQQTLVTITRDQFLDLLAALTEAQKEIDHKAELIAQNIIGMSERDVQIQILTAEVERLKEAATQDFVIRRTGKFAETLDDNARLAARVQVLEDENEQLYAQVGRARHVIGKLGVAAMDASQQLVDAIGELLDEKDEAAKGES